MSLERTNQTLSERAPVLFELLSRVGRQAFFPPDIPAQAADAAGTRYNGTIGVFTDGHRNAMPMPSMSSALDFDLDERNRAFLYSPVLGFPDLRRAWRTWQRTEQPDVAPPAGVTTTLPVVVGGLTHGLSLVADLFADDGKPMITAAPFWGNYRQTFTLRTGADVREIPVYRDGAYCPQVVIDAVDALDDGQPALVMLNFPSNPGGYSPTAAERQLLVDGLSAAAAKRPLLAICDDAYGGLVFEEGVPNRSIFWDLIGRHEQLIPVKIDGATKEFAFFGGRVAFVTLGVDLDIEATKAIENKMQCLIRATIGSPSATAQRLLMRSLQSPDGASEVMEIRRVAEERYAAVAPALAELDPKLLRLMPFNAGFFALLELVPDLDPHDVRRHLIAEHSTGVVAIKPNYIRLALCSVAAGDLVEMVRRVESGVRELAAQPTTV